MSDSARVEGLRAEVGRIRDAGRNAVVVTTTMAAFERMAAALAPHEPSLYRDRFERDSLRRRLESGGSVAIATPGALPDDGKPGEGMRCDLLIFGRSAERSADEAIVQAADRFGAGTRVTFHLSLDDALLQDHGKTLKPLLEKLGMSADEPVTSPFLTRAIANAQHAKHR